MDEVQGSTVLETFAFTFALSSPCLIHSHALLFVMFRDIPFFVIWLVFKLLALAMEDEKFRPFSLKHYSFR